MMGDHLSKITIPRVRSEGLSGLGIFTYFIIGTLAYCFVQVDIYIIDIIMQCLLD
jgi:hypothetical protein